MQKIPGPFRVYVGLVPSEYKNEQSIAQIIRNGLLYCNVLNPQNTSSIVLKTDIPAPYSKFTKNACTHSKFLSIAIQEILKINPGASIHLTCDSASTSVLKTKEFKHLFSKKVKFLSTESGYSSLYYLSKGNDRASNIIKAPEIYSQNPFSIYCPKLKNDFFVDGLGGALRLGFQSETTEMDHHICDMLEVCNPKLIITDGIVVPLGGSHATQPGYNLGAILISNNAVAHDWVACEILHLNPSSVKHLALAFKRGWGPQNIDQIELGGIGTAGLQALSQKSKPWIFNSSIINDNAKFPVEIISQQDSDPAVQSLVLDWLLANHDVPQTRKKMPKWPKNSFCVGQIIDYPTNPTIFVIGDKAISSMDNLISHSRTWFKIFGIKFQTVQLKNGRRHKLIQIPNDKNHPTPGFRRLCLAFYLGSLGKMKHPLFHFWQSLYVPQKKKQTYRKIITQDLPHNSWWAIAPTDDAVGLKHDNG